jgi:plastocyanin
MAFSPKSSDRGAAGRDGLRLAAIVLVGVLGCSGEGNGKPDDCVPVTDGGITIDGTVAGWEPDCLEVPAGTKVRFTADLLDELPHDLEVSGPGLRPVGTGDPVTGGPLSLEVAFVQAGSYRYACTTHAKMEGSIYVEK